MKRGKYEQYRFKFIGFPARKARQGRVDVLGLTHLNESSRLWGLGVVPSCLGCFRTEEIDMVCVNQIKEGLGGMNLGLVGGFVMPFLCTCDIWIVGEIQTTRQFGSVINGCQRQIQPEKIQLEPGGIKAGALLQMQDSFYENHLKFSSNSPSCDLYTPQLFSKPPKFATSGISTTSCLVALVSKLSHLLSPSVLVPSISSVCPSHSLCLLPLPWVRLPRLCSLLIHLFLCTHAHPSFTRFPE